MNVILVIGLKTEYLVLVSVRYAGQAKVRSEREREREILYLSVFELRYVQQLLQCSHLFHSPINIS